MWNKRWRRLAATASASRPFRGEANLEAVSIERKIAMPRVESYTLRSRRISGGSRSRSRTNHPPKESSPAQTHRGSTEPQLHRRSHRKLRASMQELKASEFGERAKAKRDDYNTNSRFRTPSAT